MEGHTSIIVAHRLSTIQNCDSIAVLCSGSVVEQGSHSALLKAKGRYWGLVEAQIGLPDQSSRMTEAFRDVTFPTNSAQDEDGIPPLLSFNNVCFCYPSRPGHDVLKDWNLQIRKGENIAIVGARYVTQTLSRKIFRTHPLMLTPPF